MLVTIYFMDYIRCGIHDLLDTHYIRYTICFVFYTLYSTLYALHCALHTTYYTLHTTHYILHTIQYILHTTYYVHCYADCTMLCHTILYHTRPCYADRCCTVRHTRPQTYMMKDRASILVIPGAMQAWRS